MPKEGEKCRMLPKRKNVFAGMDIGSRYYKNYRTYTIFGGIE